jgi:hypothetical protein
MRQIKWSLALIILLAILPTLVSTKKMPPVKTYQITGEDATYIYLGAEVNPLDKDVTYYCEDALCSENPGSSYFNCNCTLTIDVQYILTGNKVLQSQSYNGLLDHTGIFQSY